MVPWTPGLCGITLCSDRFTGVYRCALLILCEREKRKQRVREQSQSHRYSFYSCLASTSPGMGHSQPVPPTHHLSLRTFPGTCNPNLPPFSLNPFPLIPPLSTRVKSSFPSCLQALFEYWKADMGSLNTAEQTRLPQLVFIGKVLTDGQADLCVIPAQS